MEKLKEQKAKEIIKYFNLDERTRRAVNVDPRFLFYSYLYKNGYKLAEIGKLFNRNHVNVLNGVRKNKIQEETKKVSYVKNTEKLRAYLNGETIELRQKFIINDIKNVQEKLDSMIDKINNLNTTEI
jgi:hypothetical protein